MLHFSTLPRFSWACVNVVVQSLSCVRLFVTPWTAACLASLSFTVSPSWLTLMSIDEWSHLTILSCVAPFFSCPQSFPASGSFPVNQFFASSGQIYWSFSIPMNIQGWFPLGLTGLISLLFKGLSRVFSNTTIGKHQFSARGLLNGPILTSIHDSWKNHSFD